MILIDSNSLVAKLRGGEAEPVNAGIAVFFFFRFFHSLLAPNSKVLQRSACRTKICMRAGFMRCRNLTFLIRL